METARAGGVSFYQPHYAERVFGVIRYRLLLLLYFVGMLGAGVWIIVSYLASVPSSGETMKSSDTSVIFTILFAFHLLLLITAAVIMMWVSGERRLASGERKTTTHTVWEGISVLNKRRINSATLIILFTLAGLLITQVTFLSSRSQGYNVHFSDYMFDNTSGIIQQSISDIGGTCQTEIETRCAVTAFDNYLAQAFINTNQVALILTMFLFYGYWELFLALYWLNGIAHKTPNESALHLSIIGYKKATEVEKLGSTLFITHQSPGKARTDFSLKLQSVALILTVIVFTVLWIMQLITLSGIYNGLCRFLDKFLVFWVTNFTLFGAAFVVFTVFLLNLTLKKSLVEDTSTLQKDNMKWLVIAFIIGVVSLGSVGLIWFINTSTLTVFEIPTQILCRVAGVFRTYNAIVVYESLVFLFLINEVFEYYFLHRLKIGGISMENKPEAKSID